MTKITKAVIPAAGYGTRFLPWTKTMPKEMLPVLNKPFLHYIVNELILSGITTVIFITSSNKKATEDYFDRNLELEHKLRESGKTQEIAQMNELLNKTNFIFIRQHEQLGNGHAVLQALPVIKNEPILMTWGDEIIFSKPPIYRQIIDAYEKYPGNYMALLKSPAGKLDLWAEKYGNAKGKELGNGIIKIEKIIEKPGAGKAFSDLFSLGAFIFEPEYLQALSKQKPEKGGEIWWNSAMDQFISQGQVYGKIIKEDAYLDLGNPLGFLKANLYFAKEDPAIRQEINEWIKSIKL